jgi:hypothetical protein
MVVQRGKRSIGALSEDGKLYHAQMWDKRYSMGCYSRLDVIGSLYIGVC